MRAGQRQAKKRKGPEKRNKKGRKDSREKYL